MPLGGNVCPDPFVFSNGRLRFSRRVQTLCADVEHHNRQPDDRTRRPQFQ